jgi:hypothetical protein
MSTEKTVPLVNTKMNPGDKLANLRNRVEVTATDKNPWKKKGTVSKVSPMVAEKGKKLGHFEK